MPVFFIPRFILRNPNPFPSPFLRHRSISTSPSLLLCNNKTPQFPNSPIPDPDPPPSPTQNPCPPYPLPRLPRSKTKTPLEKQFETWVEKLKPGFTPADVDEALRAQSDPDLALDIFRWTAQRRGYSHDHTTYLTIIQISVRTKHFRNAEALVEEVIAGACRGSLPLYNAIIRFCCGRKVLFNRAFDVYNIMLKSQDCKPTLETYNMLFNRLLRKFSKRKVAYVYLRAVQSLRTQMKRVGVMPDIFVLNIIIKAYSTCLEVDEAIRVFNEMGLYGCEPNAFSYSYISKGLCEKGRVNRAMHFYKEMRNKDLVPNATAYMILICSLSLERSLEDAIEVMFDMLSCSRRPDFLTYKTLLEELCREGRGDDAFDLLEKFRERDAFMSGTTYKSLLDELHFVSRD